MFQYWLKIIAFHAGTSPVVSQTIMSVMFVILGIFLMGIGFGYLTKNREGLLQHRWVLSAAVALSLGAIVFGILPSFIRYYGDPDVEFYSALSGTTLLHAIISTPAIIIAAFYVFGILPRKNLKKWMRWTAVLWIVSLVIGIVLFLQMFNLLPSMPGM